MFIILGWRGIAEHIGEGKFFCPDCRQDSGYNHQQIRTWFTLFFIPVLPLFAGERAVQCRRCQRSYIEAVLEMRELLGGGSNSVPAVLQSGDRVLGKRGDFWYVGTIRSKSGKRFKVHFDDGKQDLLAKPQLTALDLRAEDPVFVRGSENGDYEFGHISAVEEEKLQVRFADGRQVWTKFRSIRVIWEQEGGEEPDDRIMVM